MTIVSCLLINVKIIDRADIAAWVAKTPVGTALTAKCGALGFPALADSVPIRLIAGFFGRVVIGVRGPIAVGLLGLIAPKAGK